jgi:metal-responsive CopG/Arc/MetJ family transcriptional regulator
MRTLVDIPDKQLKALSELSKQRKTSRAALVREAVSKYLAENSKSARKAAIDAAFGIWKDREFDGLGYQKNIRAEWDDR